MSISESTTPPDDLTCRDQHDLGRLHHDTSTDIWYECMFDKRAEIYTWSIVPPTT